MARRGRPPKGPDLVDALDASEDAKARAKIFLQTIQGTLSVAEASTRLGVGEARFHEMRSEWLVQATALLEPKPRGRPPAPEPSKEQQRLEVLEAKINDLRRQVSEAQLRERMALLMPEVMQNRFEGPGKKKT